MIRDGSGAPVKTQAGIHVGAGGAKDVAVDAAAREISRKLDATGEGLDTRSEQAKAVIKDMATGLVDASLDAPKSTPAQQEVMVRASASAALAQEKSMDMAQDLELFSVAGGVTETTLRNGSAQEKMEALQALNQVSEILQARDMPLRPEMQYLADTLSAKVPDVTALHSLNGGLQDVSTMVTQKSLDMMSDELRQDLATALRESATALPADTPNREEVIQSVEALTRAVEQGDGTAAQTAHESAVGSVEKSAELVAEQVTQSMDDPSRAALRGEFLKLAQEAEGLVETANADMERMSDSWNASQNKELNWGELSEPAHAFAAARDAGTLREWLGDAAAGFSDEDLMSAVSPETQSRASDMGLTAEDVQAAKKELQQQAVQAGRDPASVDEAVALDSLVGASAQKDRAEQGAATRQNTAEEGAEVEAAQAEAEMGAD